jgi:hypothetical protein
MAQWAQITCITKSNRFNPHERITHVGGVNWYWTQQQAIQAIDADQWRFFINQGGQSVEVIVETSRYGHRYLKTKADGEQPNNLLSLAECR